MHIATLDDEARRALEFVPATLAAALDLKPWLERKIAGRSFARRIEFVSTYTASDMEPDNGFIFYDEAQAGGRTIPVTGVLQRMFFDRASAAGDLPRLRESLRAFALRYFLRVCENRRPEAAHRSADHTETLQGFGFTNWFYKNAGGLSMFPVAGDDAVVDLREIGTKYEWIAVRAEMYNYLLPWRPFGVNAFQMAIPMRAQVAGIIAPPLVIEQDDPEPGVMGRYGVSFAMPALARQGNLMAFGPGLFDPCLHQMLFELRADGTIFAEARLVVNQPEAILQVPIEPVAPTIELLKRTPFTRPLASLVGAFPWPFRGASFDPVMPSIEAANRMTAGQASRLGISREEVTEAFLEKHFETDYFVLLNLLRTYRRVADWTGEVPGWAQTGVI